MFFKTVAVYCMVSKDARRSDVLRADVVCQMDVDPIKDKPVQWFVPLLFKNLLASHSKPGHGITMLKRYREISRTITVCGLYALNRTIPKGL